MKARPILVSDPVPTWLTRPLAYAGGSELAALVGMYVDPRPSAEDEMALALLMRRGRPRPDSRAAFNEALPLAVERFQRGER